jgi:tetratricopeptide (TPR) repeat protein
LDAARDTVESFRANLERTAPRHYALAVGGIREGKIALARGDWARAIECFERSLVSVSERGNPAFLVEIQAEAEAGLLEAALSLDRPEEARLHADRGDAVARAFAEPYIDAIANRARGRYEARFGDREAAIRRLQESARVWETLELRYELARTLDHLGEVYLERGEGEKAREPLARALGLFREMGATRDEERARARQSPAGRRSE